MKLTVEDGSGHGDCTEKNEKEEESKLRGHHDREKEGVRTEWEGIEELRGKGRSLERTRRRGREEDWDSFRGDYDKNGQRIEGSEFLRAPDFVFCWNFYWLFVWLKLTQKQRKQEWKRWKKSQKEIKVLADFFVVVTLVSEID